MSENQKTFFASRNTTRGFQSNFSTIFDPNVLNKIYILKGGPGCGKSSLMKRIAAKAAKVGEPFELFLCSSDPESLDGIILSEQKIAILDGTAPHLTDPNIPGVIENIVNLGSYWDVKKLTPSKQIILKLIHQKKLAYKSAYRYLEAYGKIVIELQSFSSKALLNDKMHQNIKVQSKHVFKSSSKEDVVIRNISTICKNGFLELDSFKNSSEKVWIIEDCLFSASLYLKAFYEYAKNNRQKLYVSYSPEIPDLPNALYFPDTRSCFIIGKRNYQAEEPDKEYHYINMKRFLDPESLKSIKNKARFCNKCLDELLQGACCSLKDAANYHSELEKYYTAAMDFKKIEETERDLISAIFH